MIVHEVIESIKKSSQDFIRIENFVKWGFFKQQVDAYRYFQSNTHLKRTTIGRNIIFMKQDVINFLASFDHKAYVVTVFHYSRPKLVKSCRQCFTVLTDEQKKYCSLNCCFLGKIAKLPSGCWISDQVSLIFGPLRLTLKRVSWMIHKNLKSVNAVYLENNCSTKGCVNPEHLQLLAIKPQFGNLLTRTKQKEYLSNKATPLLTLEKLQHDECVMFINDLPDAAFYPAIDELTKIAIEQLTKSIVNGNFDGNALQNIECIKMLQEKWDLRDKTRANS